MRKFTFRTILTLMLAMLATSVFAQNKKPEAGKWYRLVAMATDAARANKCLELLTDDARIATVNAAWQKGNAGNYNNNANSRAKQNRAWFCDLIDTSDPLSDCQYWKFEEDPNNAGKYALVCKAKPDGSLNSNPTVSMAVNGRFDYDETSKHYGYSLMENYYSVEADGNFIYALTTTELQASATNKHLNVAAMGQGISANVYTNVNDGSKSGLFKFVPRPEEIITYAPLEVGKRYTFTSNGTTFNPAIKMIDSNSDVYLRHSSNLWSNDAWEVVASRLVDGTQLVTLKSVATGRFISTVNALPDGNVGFPIQMGESGVELTIGKVEHEGAGDVIDFAIGDKKVWAIPGTSSNKPNVMSCGTSSTPEDFTMAGGLPFDVAEVVAKKYVCQLENGTNLGVGYFWRSFLASANMTTAQYVANAPAFDGYVLLSATQDASNADVVNCVYAKSSYTVSMKCEDQYGGILSRTTTTVNRGTNYTVEIPTFEYYQLESISVANSTQVQVLDDMTITATYSTDAHGGCVRAADIATTIEPNKSYLIKDVTSNTARVAFRYVNEAVNSEVHGKTSEVDSDPSITWTPRPTDKENYYKMQNSDNGLYVPALAAGQKTTMSENGENFFFVAVSGAANQWNIRSDKGQQWDGEGGTTRHLVGWSGNGHPHEFYTYFVAPYYLVTINCVNRAGETLKTVKTWVKAGENYTLELPEISGLYANKVVGYSDENQPIKVTKDTPITITYSEYNLGVENVEAAEAETVIYDLSGRRLKAITSKGLYIVNGKKVVVK